METSTLLLILFALILFAAIFGTFPFVISQDTLGTEPMFYMHKASWRKIQRNLVKKTE